MKLVQLKWQVVAVSFGLAGTPLGYADTYFDWLTSLPEHHASTDLGSSAEVIRHVHYEDKSKATTEYDPSMDAAKFTIAAGQDDIEIGDQVRFDFPYLDRGNVVVYWEAYAPSYWATNGDVDGISTYKAFQLGLDDERSLEIRYRLSDVNSPYVARIDTRVYGNQQGVATDGNKITPQVGEFEVRPNTWTQFWAFLDYDNNRFSLWVGDYSREPVKLLDVAFDWQQNYGLRYGINQFWYEYNSSQTRSGGPTTYMWGRNVAVLHGIRDLEALIAQNESIEEPVPPAAPVLNSVQ